MDEWLKWLVTPAVGAIFAVAVAWGGGIIARRWTLQDAKQARTDAMQVRAELREHDRERDVETAARARNRETRHAIERLVELTDERTKAFFEAGPEEDMDHVLECHRLRRRLQARLATDLPLLQLQTRLWELYVRLETIHTARVRGQSWTETIEKDASATIAEAITVQTKLQLEMEARNWPW